MRNCRNGRCRKVAYNGLGLCEGRAGIEGGIKGLPKVGENLGNAFDSITTNVTKYPKQIADKITKG